MVSSHSVVGLGKLGACMAACLAERGHRVVGVDVRPEVVAALDEGRAPVFEPGLADLIASNRERLSATTNHEAAVLASDVTFIVVPTPSTKSGGFSLHHVADAAGRIGRALRRKDRYHLVVLTSTVLPGATEHSVLPILEKESGKRCGQDFGLCYSPEFIALGTVIRDFLSPDFVLIGESDPIAGTELEDLYSAVCTSKPRVARTSFVNAELAKIAVNAFVTTKISFANTLAELCEVLPGGDVDEVTGAVGLDSRIGRSYLKGGLGYGGPCFPRDNVAFAYLAREVGAHPDLAQATHDFNGHVAARLETLVAERAGPSDTVAVLGLAYKPGSNVVEESQGLWLANRLAARGLRVVVHDPIALPTARAQLGDDVIYRRSLPEALAEADVVVVTTSDPAYGVTTPADLPRRPVALIDCWRGLRSSLEGVEGIHYVALGAGPAGTAASDVLRDICRDLGGDPDQEAEPTPSEAMGS